ncbi:MAG: amidohydrolase [Oscillospiraceae bacterium]|nr:amidohydrolase [Clostridia bacterium]MBQ9149263.1 amidohydrolase [Oscillospiraceae bacterium]
MTIIDTHAHIYPDKIALRASQSIADFYDMPVVLDGSVGMLLQKGAEAGISRHLVHSVAVSWERAASINDFIAASVEAHPGKLIGFGAMHPNHPEMEKELDRIMALGLKGVKLHPDFQKFMLDDPAALRLFEAMAERDLPLLVHTGDYRYPYSTPERMARALDHVPRLRAICAHLGGWSVWSDAWKLLAGRENVYVDSCSSLYAMSPEEAVKIIHRYGADKVFFGTDYPMWNLTEEVARFMALPLTEEEREMILHRNFERFIGEEEA